MTLIFAEDTHEYRLDGNLIPSVTELLKPLTAEQFGAISPETLRIAAERGTEVHEACECIDYGIEPEPLSPDAVGYVEAYLQFLYDHDVEWYGIEEMGYCTDFPVDYAGTVDRWGLVDGEVAIVDIKTVQSPTIEQKIAVTLQTYLYDWIIGQKHEVSADRTYALYLRKNGDYMLFDCAQFERDEKIKPFAVIHDLMALHQKRGEILENIKTIKDRHKRRRINEDE